MTKTARTYAQALYELAREERLDAQLLSQLQMAARLLAENPQYARLLALPSIPKSERCRIVDESFRAQVHPYLLNFMKILVEHGTISQLADCEVRFRALYNHDHGILEATAVTASVLSEPLRAQLLEKLRGVTGKQIVLVTRVDASVLGGIRLELDGKLLDSTVQTRLSELRQRLRETVL